MQDLFRDTPCLKLHATLPMLWLCRGPLRQCRRSCCLAALSRACLPTEAAGLKYHVTLARLLQGLFGDTPGLEPHAILPTVGLNVGRLEAFQAQLLIWDLGGAPGLRSIWDKYYADSHALLFVVDASQPARCATTLTVSNILPEKQSSNH